MTRYLSLDDALHAMGRLGFTARDTGLIASSLARPATTLGGADAYPALELKAASLLESAVRNHCLIDGNKRFAWVLTSLFMWINGRRLEAPTDDAFDLIVGIAEGRHDLEHIETLLRQWNVVRPEGLEPPTF